MLWILSTALVVFVVFARSKDVPAGKSRPRSASDRLGDSIYARSLTGDHDDVAAQLRLAAYYPTRSHPARLPAEFHEGGSWV